MCVDLVNSIEYTTCRKVYVDPVYLKSAFGDLSMRNLYLSPSGGPGLIDLDGVKIFSLPVKDKYREEEIARLISSFFMLVSYLEGNDRKIPAIPEKYVTSALENYPHKLNADKVLKKIEKFIRRGQKYL